MRAGGFHGKLGVIPLTAVIIAVTLLPPLPLPFHGIEQPRAVARVPIGMGANPSANVPTPSAPVTVLRTSETPGAICESPALACDAGTDMARVTISATTSSAGTAGWPAVQVLFVLETTAYDGSFDWYGSGETFNSSNRLILAVCSSAWPYQLCGEANSVGAFVSNASAIVEGMQAAHPATRLSFGLVDYFATHDQWGNANGSEYHVDIGNFVPADQFQSAVNATLLTQVLNDSPILRDSGLAENFLHTSSITALYGALSGAGIAWAPDTHHVIVWIGSTVPRDPHYVVNYCVSQSAHANHWATNLTKPGCYSSGWEPSYNFTPTMESPAGEGWVVSQDGNPNNSIAALAKSSPPCVDSLGGNCTIDTIEVPGGADWAGPHGAYYWTPNGTDSYGRSWGCLQWGNGYCAPAGIVDTQQIWQNVNRTRDAACDLAMATGGSWDGPRLSFPPWAWPFGPWPSYWTAPESCSGYTGDLQEPALWGTTLWTGPCIETSWPFCDRGTEYFNETNPTLISALSRISLGAAPYSLSLRGAVNTPLFTFVPSGNIELAPYLEASIACESAAPFPGGCDTYVGQLPLGSTTALTFNWSADPNLNVMQAGDSWQASFNVIAVGPPYGVAVPVDACIAPGCAAAGSQPVEGFFTRADYTLASNGSSVVASFPLAELIVENSTPSGPPPTSTPPPPPPGGETPPLPAPLPLPVAQPIPVASLPVTAGLISIPAVAAGILIAGLTRIVVRSRTVSMRIAVTAGPTSRPRGGAGSAPRTQGGGPRW